MKSEWPSPSGRPAWTLGPDLSALSSLEVQYEVTQIMLAYCACIDEDRLEEWPAFFSPHGVYEMATRDNADRNLPATAMQCEGIGMMRDRVVSLRHANVYAKQYYRHLVTDVRILERSAHVLRASSNYLVTRTVASEGDPIVFSVGRTDDLIELGPEGLLFRRRRVVADNDRIHTLLVLPI